MEYILFDLEAVGKNIKNDFMEIVEIAAYKICVKNKMKFHNEYMKRSFVPQCVIVDTFHSFIKPIFHSINKKTMKLTGIDDLILNECRDYSVVSKSFFDWAGDTTIFVSWSDNDRKMIEINNSRHFLDYSSRISYLDLQKEYDRVFMKSKKTSLIKATQEIGCLFKGKQHNAMDDAYNMILIFQKLFPEIYTPKIPPSETIPLTLSLEKVG